MVTQQQLRSMMGRIQSPSSQESLRKQTISNIPKTTPLSKEEWEKQQIAEIIQKNVSKLEAEQQKAREDLAKFEQAFNQKVDALKQEGKLDTDLQRALNREYVDARSYLVGNVQGYEKALSEARKGAYTLDSLKEYAEQVSSSSQQSQAVQTAMQKELSQIPTDRSEKIAYMNEKFGKGYTYNENEPNVITSVRTKQKFNYPTERAEISRNTNFLENIETNKFSIDKTKGSSRVDLNKNLFFDAYNKLKTGSKNLYESVVKNKYVSWVLDPLGENPDYVSVGGRIMKREDYDKYSDTAKRISSLLSPENILLFGEFPTGNVVQSETIFSGVKQSAEGDRLFTALKYSTSTGRSGEALGVSQIVGKEGNLFIGESAVVGTSAEKAIDLMRINPDFILTNKNIFAGAESFIGAVKNGASVSLGVGKIIQRGSKVERFGSAGFGINRGGTSFLWGGSRTTAGENLNLGFLRDFSKAKNIDSSINFVGGSGGKTSLTSTFSEGALQSTQNIVSSAVASTSTETSQMGGLGGIFFLKNQDITTTEAKPISEQTFIQKDLDEIKTSSGQNLFFIQEEKSQTLNKTQQIFKTNEEQKEILKVAQIPILETMQKNPPSIKLGLKIDLINPIIQKSKIKLPQKTPPKKPTPFSLGLGKAVSKIKQKMGEESFEVFGKRFGEDISIFKGTSKEKAQEKLFQFLKGSLGRSGKILKDGKSLSFKELPLFQNREFRPSKKSKERVVQKAKYSLGTFGERSEIQRARKSKRKKKKSKNIFGL